MSIVCTPVMASQDVPSRKTTTMLPPPLNAALSSQPPPPQHNTDRSSRFLDALVDTSKASPSIATSDVSVAMTAPPSHDIYLSSEEDASSFDDCSDSLYDADENDDYDDEDDDDMDDGSFFDNNQELAATYTLSPGLPRTISTSAPATASLPTFPPTEESTTTTSVSPPSSDPPAPTRRRHSHDTARIVSVIFAGKPSLVDLTELRAIRRGSLPSLRSLHDTQGNQTKRRWDRSHRSSSVSVDDDDNAMPERSSVSLNDATTDPRRHLPSYLSSSSAYDSTLASFRSRAALQIDPACANRTSTSNSNTARTTVLSHPPPPPPPPPSTISVTPRSLLFRGVSRRLTLSRRKGRVPLHRHDTAASVYPLDPPTPTTPNLPVDVDGEHDERDGRDERSSPAPAMDLGPNNRRSCSNTHLSDADDGDDSASCTAAGASSLRRSSASNGFLVGLAGRRRRSVKLL